MLLLTEVICNQFNDENVLNEKWAKVGLIHSTLSSLLGSMRDLSIRKVCMNRNFMDRCCSFFA